jgi:1,4-alpha-glucan branching enzyme
MFSYANSKARQVALRADFTGWKAEAMKRDARGIWTFRTNLPPGEYAYIFMVDDSPKKDPANKRTKRIGTTQVSAVVIKAAPAH